MHETVELARQLVGARRVSLLLPSDELPILRIVASSGIPAAVASMVQVQPGEGIAGLVAQTRQPLLVNGDLAGIRLRATTDYMSSSFISVPILFEPYGCGVLNVADPLRDNVFSREDLASLQVFAQLVARALVASKAEAHRWDAQEQSTNLHHQLIEAQELERGRLARDLHDEAGHTLATAIFRLDLEARKLSPESMSAVALSRSRDALMACAETLHNLAFTLHPRILADLGLLPALRSLITQVEEIGQLQIDLAVHGTPNQLRPEVKLAAFRVVQEALTNVRKHAETDRAWVILTFDVEQLQVVIEDAGIGLVADPLLTQRSATLGLGGMRERVELLGGTFHLISRGEGGLIVSACLPLDNAGGQTR